MIILHRRREAKRIRTQEKICRLARKGENHAPQLCVIKLLFFWMTFASSFYLASRSLFKCQKSFLLEGMRSGEALIFQTKNLRENLESLKLAPFISHDNAGLIFSHYSENQFKIFQTYTIYFSLNKFDIFMLSRTISR